MHEDKRSFSYDRDGPDEAYKRVKRKKTHNYDKDYDDDGLGPSSSNKNYWMKKLVQEEEKQAHR